MPTMVSKSPRPNPKRFTGQVEKQEFTPSKVPTFTTPAQVAQVAQASTYSGIYQTYCASQIESSYCNLWYNKSPMSSRSSISNISRTTMASPSYPHPQSPKSISSSTMSTTTALHKRRKGSISSLSLFKLPFRFSLSKNAPRKLSIDSSTSQRSRRESTSSSTSTTTSSSTRSESQDSDEAVYGFPFGRPLPETNTRGRDLGSMLSGTPHTSHPFEAHPGTLVSFSSPDLAPTDLDIEIDIDTISLTTSSSTPSASIDAQDHSPSSSSSYHSYLRSTMRSYSTPPSTRLTRNTTAPLATRPTTTTIITTTMTPPPRPCRQNISYQKAKLSRRTRSLSVRERELREGVSPSSSSSSSYPSPRSRNPSTTTQASTTSSTSAISLDEFLSRIRSSVDRQRSRSLEGGESRMGAAYDVFVDEVERGFIGEEDL